MVVSENVKNAYKSNSITKYVTLYFPEIDREVSMRQIEFDSMRLSESVMESDSIAFVGCIASKFSIRVQALNEDVKGKRMIVTIHTEGTEDEPIPLFCGIVDSAVKQSNRQIKELTAYDELYTKGNTEVSAWYNSLSFPITLRDLRDSLFRYIGIEQAKTDLPNDGISIERQYEPNSLQALSVVKAVCQINGAFGIINRDGCFEYRILGDIEEEEGTYPSENLFPSEDLFPEHPTVKLAAAQRYAESINAEHFSFYKSVNYEEFEVKPVDKLTVRQSENDAGVSCGSGINNYIIQGNMFTYGLPVETLRTIAGNIYPNVQGFSYIPFTSQNNGLPFLECGLDAVSYTMIDYDQSTQGSVVYKQMVFYILRREMTGIQVLGDSYSAEGEEYQTEFVTDLQTQIDILKRNSSADNTYTKETIDEMFREVAEGGVIAVESVQDVPKPPTQNVIYLIRGEVMVV